MNRIHSRRQFIKNSTFAVSSLAFAGLSSSTFAADKAVKAPPLFKISLAQWSLNRRLFKKEEPHMDALDFAKFASDHGIRGLEYVNQFFSDKAEDQSYLNELKKRAKDNGVKNLLIMIDREGNLGEPDGEKRQTAVENHYKWVEAAKFLGCHSIRVNARSNANLSYEEQLNFAADGLAKLNEFGTKHDIGIIVENHGGLSSNGKWLVDVIRKVDHPNCGTLPDFGNFAIDRQKDEWYDRYKGVEEMMPYAKAVSAKAHAFDKKREFITIDERSGKETDYLKMMKIVLDAGYRGWVGIESEGAGNQEEGVTETKQLLIRVRNRLAKEYKA
ncbi:sugar phosphate isomerase/epimerase [bacterium]|nr:sugar phosphate isomerase/epimerase [bacterium]